MPLSDNSKDQALLRQTCNRCRELKVRCQSRESGAKSGNQHDPTNPTTTTSSVTPGFSCLRCSRAGAVCMYGSKQRSGRPRAHKKRQYSTSPPSLPAVSPRPSNSPIQNHPVEPFTWLPSPHGDVSSESWAMRSNSSESAALLDELQFSGLEAGPSELDTPMTPALNELLPHHEHDAVIASLMVDHTTAFIPNSPASIRTPRGTRHQHEQQREYNADIVDDSIIEETTATTELNLRIYRLQAHASITAPPTANLCDDLTSVTQTLMKIIRGFSQRSRPPLSSASSLETSPAHQAKGGSEARFRNQVIDPFRYADENCTLDNSIFLLILACYQRITDLFTQTCLSMHAHIQEHNVSPSTMARVVMTTELISHLSSRLDRGLYQLMPRMGHSTTPSSLTTVPWSASEGGCNKASSLYDGFFDGQSIAMGGEFASHKTTYNNSPFYQSLTSVIDKMTQTQISLRAHIASIKHSLQELDKI